MNLILLGPPGAGKGTVATKLSKELNVPHISTGNLFRAAIKNQTTLGKKVQTIINAGELVPDKITVAMVKERLEEDDAKDGFILDGFPRTIGQADALKDLTKIDSVINLEVSENLIVERLSGRRVCRACGFGHHTLFMPPKQEGVCDQCGGELYTRKDDEPESIKKRLTEYSEKTAPLISYYTDNSLITNIDGGKTPKEVLLTVIEHCNAL